MCERICTLPDRISAAAQSKFLESAAEALDDSALGFIFQAGKSA
jgi:hypothetical protein